MKSIYSVFQINEYIHNMFGADYLLNDVSVTGEISNLKYHSSGHVYFTLKDDQSAISCVIFRSSAARLKEKLCNGDKIVASGSIGNYIPNGSITFTVSSVENAGLGDLTKRFEELKTKLRNEGLFDNEFKSPIPKNPRKIGIVTASTGAAVRDIISVSKRRNPYISLILYPATVQGPEASLSIVAGIEALEEYGVDLIIVGRGGGSIEDLWAFNEENVAYAIFQSSVPVISAVGHETDFTIADFVADLRAPTPSAAAELAVPDISIYFESIDKIENKLDYTMNGIISHKRKDIDLYTARLKNVSPVSKINMKKMRLDSFETRCDNRIKSLVIAYKSKNENLSERLRGVSPLERLSAGMAYVTDASGRRITRISSLKPEDSFKIIMKDGSAQAVVKETLSEELNG